MKLPAPPGALTQRCRIPDDRAGDNAKAGYYRAHKALADCEARRRAWQRFYADVRAKR